MRPTNSLTPREKDVSTRLSEQCELMEVARRGNRAGVPRDSVNELKWGQEGCYQSMKQCGEGACTGAQIFESVLKEYRK